MSVLRAAIATRHQMKKHFFPSISAPYVSMSGKLTATDPENISSSTYYIAFG